MGKLLLIVSMVFTLATAVLGFLNQGKIASAREEVATITSDRDKAKSDLNTAKTALNTANTTLETTKAEKEQLAGQVTSLQGDLDKAKSDVLEKTKEVTAKQTELESVTKERDELKDKIANAAQPTEGTTASQGEIDDLKAQLLEKDTLINKLTADTQTAKQELVALKAVEDARSKRQLAKGLEGQILAVNPAWNFVVLNLGDKNGVASNTELLVKRGNQLVGKVRVTSVEPSTSIADIVARSVPAGTTIAPGDNVIFQSEE